MITEKTTLRMATRRMMNTVRTTTKRRPANTLQISSRLSNLSSSSSSSSLALSSVVLSVILNSSENKS